MWAQVRLAVVVLLSLQPVVAGAHVGFEFEATAGRIGPVAQGEIAKGTVIFEWGDYRITADTVGGGHNSYEFVTDPFEESVNGRRRMCTAMRGLVDWIGRVTRFCVDEFNRHPQGQKQAIFTFSGPQRTHKRMTVCQTARLNGVGTYDYSWGPQVTMSMTPEQTWRLFKVLLNTVQQRRDDFLKIFGTQTEFFLRFVVGAVDSLYGNSNYSDGFKTFLAFVVSYAIDWQISQKSRACSVAYPKAIGNVVLMRTNLAEFWHHAVVEGRNHISQFYRKPAALRAMLDAVVARANQLRNQAFPNNPNLRNYAYCRYQNHAAFWTSIHNNAPNHRWAASPTVNGFLRSLLNDGVDALSDNKYSVLPNPTAGRASFADDVRNADTKRAALLVRMNDVNRPQAERDEARDERRRLKFYREGLGRYPLAPGIHRGVIFEWRELNGGDPLRPERIIATLYDLAYRIRTGKTVTVMKIHDKLSKYCKGR